MEFDAEVLSTEYTVFRLADSRPIRRDPVTVPRPLPSLLNPEPRTPNPSVSAAIPAQPLHQFADDDFRVAEEHVGSLAEVQLVLDPGKAGVHAPLDREAGAGLVGIDDR